ncbi:MAG: hypothetical protein ABSE73_19830, partial [Planctomycetota bacterium]
MDVVAVASTGQAAPGGQPEEDSACAKPATSEDGETKSVKFTDLPDEAELLADLRARCDSIKLLARRTIEQVMAASKSLVRLRDGARHGQWGPLLKHLGISEGTARNWMNVHEAAVLDQGFAARLPSLDPSEAYDQARAIVHGEPTGAPAASQEADVGEKKRESAKMPANVASMIPPPAPATPIPPKWDYRTILGKEGIEIRMTQPIRTEYIAAALGSERMAALPNPEWIKERDALFATGKVTI